MFNGNGNKIKETKSAFQAYDINGEWENQC